MSRRWMVVLLVGAALMAAQAASAQTFVFTVSLTSHNEPVAPGASVIPFFDTTRPFGSGTIVVDLLERTVSYSIRVFNLPGGVTSQIRIGAAGATGPVVVNFGPPLPASVVLNNISDDVCYDIPAFAFDGTVRETEFVPRPELGIRSADDLGQAMLKGNAYVIVGSAAQPDLAIRGSLVPRK